MNYPKIAIIGLGRIGRVHLRNLCTAATEASVIVVMTTSGEGRALAEKFHIPKITTDAGEIFSDPSIDAVLICSPTDTHADYAARALRAGKAVLCEKPLDLSLRKVQEIVLLAKESGVPLMLAFNQRFDPHFRAVKDHVAQGAIGRIHTVHIISRDPEPPPVSYIRNSGGMFLDMMIHDFDMARYITGSEVAEVFATGRNLISKDIQDAGDIDTCVALLTFENEATAIIENCRKTSYGYDQRLEVFGSSGMIRAENPLKTTTQFFGATGGLLAKHPDFFMDRYATSYLLQMKAFLKAIRENEPVPVSGIDGLKAMVIAEAADRSMREGRSIKI